MEMVKTQAQVTDTVSKEETLEAKNIETVKTEAQVTDAVNKEETLEAENVEKVKTEVQVTDAVNKKETLEAENVEKVKTEVQVTDAVSKEETLEAENIEKGKTEVQVTGEVIKEEGEFTDSSTPNSPQNSQQTPPSNNVTEIDNDKDDYLLYLEEILKSIHGAFYKLLDEGLSRGEMKVPNIKDVIPYVRLKVLKGCSLVFSGVVPTEVPLGKSRPYGVALALGAQVSDKIIPPCKSGTSTATELPTTHVVAARMGTVKVNEARRYKGIHIVTPNWLWCCAERWDRVEERIFPLYKKSNVTRNPPAHCSSPELSLHHSKGEYNVMSCISPIDQLDSDVFTNKASSSKNGQTPSARKERTPSGRFMDTINPLLTFSIDEIASMGHEVDDICNESESSTSDDSESKIKKERVPIKKKPRTSIESPVPVSHNSNDSSSSTSRSSDDSEDIKNENSSQVSCHFNRKRKRLPKTETETEDESLSAKFRRGEPLPSDLECLNLAHGSTDDDQENDQEDQWMAEALEREFLDSNSQESQDC